MVQWLVILLSILMPMVMVPAILPSLVLVAKRKNITDSPNYRKLQRRPVSVMGGMVVVSSVTTAMACASLYVDLNDLFPAACMIVLLMTVGMIDDSVDMHYYVKLVIQIFVATILCFAGDYRITSLWGVFGIDMLPPVISCLLSITTGVAIMNAINFIDGIDGLLAVMVLFVCVIMAVWCLHHDELSHAIMSLIIAGALFSFLIFNGFSERYKMYMGDSGSLVLGLYVYLSICKVLSHRDVQMHISNGYELSFVMVMIAAPLFDFLRVVIWRIARKKSPVVADRTHFHHVLYDIGYSDLTVCLIITILNLLIFPIWGFAIERGMSVTSHFVLTILTCIFFINGPYFLLEWLRRYRPQLFHKFQIKIRAHRRWYSRRHKKVTRIIDKIPTFI